MRGSIVEHALIIDSYHDLNARCTCGWWEYTAPTFDYESQVQVWDRAHRQWGLHIFSRSTPHAEPPEGGADA
jgi:hypothetical protein